MLKASCLFVADISNLPITQLKVTDVFLIRFFRNDRRSGGSVEVLLEFFPCKKTTTTFEKSPQIGSLPIIQIALTK